MKGFDYTDIVKYHDNCNSSAMLMQCVGDDMKIKHLVCLLLLIIILVVANEVLAGAWWLWVRDEHFRYRKGDTPGTHAGSDWSIIADFPTEMACQQRITERIKQPASLDNWGKDSGYHWERDSGYQVRYKVTENTIHILFFEKDTKQNELDKMTGEQILYHICLPATIDPRKPSQKK